MAERLDLRIEEIVAHLAATRLFALLEPPELARLAPAFTPVLYEPGRTISRQGEVDATLWVVADGQVSYDHDEDGSGIKHLGFRGYGTVIGELGIFCGQPRANNVMTIEPTTLLTIDGEELWRTLRSDPAAFDRLVLPDHVRRQLEEEARSHQVEGEHRVALYRRHWLVLSRSLLLPASSFILALLLAVALAPLAPSATTVLALALFALALPLLGIVWAFFDYRYDCLIVTNRRVIHVERTPLIDARRSEAPLTRIQDVQVVRPTLSARVFNYGHLTIQTAGTNSTIRFRHVADPEGVRTAIFHQTDRAHDLARREQLSWIAGHLEAALGGERPAAPGEEQSGWPSTADLSLEESEGPLTSVLRGTGRLLAAALPKMRVERDSLVTWRKHWWILVRGTWFLALPLVACAVTLLVVATGNLTAPWLPLRWLALGALALLAGLWWRFEDWRNDLYQLTDEHIVDIERLPLGFFEDRRQAKLSQIQDCSYTVPNPLATLLNYGHVVIETAADQGNFSFDYVYNPAGVQEEIFARLDRHQRLEMAAARDRRAEELTQWLTQYHRLTTGSRAEAQEPPRAAVSSRN